MSSLHQYSNTANNPTTAALTGSSWDGLLTLNAGAMGNAGGGGGVVFGGNNATQYFAAIKSLLTNGAGNTTGDLAFSTRGATADTALTERLRLTADGKLGLGVQSPLSSLQQYSNTTNNPTTAAITVPMQTSFQPSEAGTRYGCREQFRSLGEAGQRVEAG